MESVLEMMRSQTRKLQLASGLSCHDMDFEREGVCQLPTVVEEEASSEDEAMEEKAALHTRHYTPIRLAQHETHIIFVIDASGSMGGPLDVSQPQNAETRLQGCFACCSNEVTRIVKKCQGSKGRTKLVASLVTFNDEANVLLDKEEVAQEGFVQRFETAIRGVVAHGRTSYRSAMQKCKELIHDLRPQCARVHLCFLSDGRPSSIDLSSENVYLNLLRGIVDRFLNRFYFHAIGIGDEGRVYLRRMTNIIKNRLHERHTSFAEATDDLRMLDGKIASTLSSSLTDTFSKFGSSVMSHMPGASSSQFSRVADGSGKDAPQCEKLDEVLAEMHRNADKGWVDYGAKELDKDRVSLRPSGDAKPVKIRQLPFAYGSERSAFLLKIKGDGKMYVAKELRRRKPREDHRFERYKVVLIEGGVIGLKDTR
jgi:hypothetical protein